VFYGVELPEETRAGLPRRDGHRLLEDDGAAVHLLIHEVDRDPGNLHSPRQGVTNRMGAWEGWKECRVDVEKAVAKAAHEHWRENPHEASQANEVNAALLAQPNEGAFVGGAGGVLPRVDVTGLDTGPGGALKRFGMRLIGQDECYAGVQASALDRAEDRLEVRALPRTEDRQRGQGSVAASGASRGAPPNR